MDEKKIRFADSGIPDDASESIGISEEKESTVPEAKIPANSYDSEGITAEQRPDRKPRRRRADPGTGGVSQPASSADDDDEIRITKIDNSDANRPAAGVPERPEKPASEAGAPEPDHRVVAGRSKKYAELNRKGQEPLKNEIEDRDPVRNENVNNPDFPVSDTGQNVEKTSEKADSEPAAPVPIPVPAGTASESVPARDQDPVSEKQAVPEANAPDAVPVNAQPEMNTPETEPSDIEPAMNTSEAKPARPEPNVPDAEPADIRPAAAAPLGEAEEAPEIKTAGASGSPEAEAEGTEKDNSGAGAAIGGLGAAAAGAGIGAAAVSGAGQNANATENTVPSAPDAPDTAEEPATPDTGAETGPEAAATQPETPDQPETPLSETTPGSPEDAGIFAKFDGKDVPAAQPVKEKKGRKKGLIAALVALLAVVCGGLGLNHFVFDADKFISGSTINSIDVSGLTAKQAENKLIKTWKSKKLTIKEDGKTVGSFSKINFNYNISDDVEKALHPGFPQTIKRTFKKEDRQYKINAMPTTSTKEFNKQFKNLSIVKDHKTTKKAKDAYVDLSNTDFKVVPEVYGDQLDKSKLKKALKATLTSEKKEFDYNPEDYYVQPKIKKDSPEIKKKLDYCDKYLKTKITYDAPLVKYTISPKQLNKLIKADDSGSITVNKSNVEKFVKDTLAPKVSTVGTTRKLKSKGGGTYTVEGGDYGLTLNTEKETSKLTSELENGQDVSRKPIFNEKTTYKNGSDIGKTYVEIDISKQHVWCVVNGKTTVSTDCVSGNASTGHSTPYGVYKLAYKDYNVTLTGRNDDGSEYHSHVWYWMPFNGGIGMHDADGWRTAYGGSIYMYNGSHGCVNLPGSAAQAIWNDSHISPGTPVIVHG